MSSFVTILYGLIAVFKLRDSPPSYLPSTACLKRSHHQPIWAKPGSASDAHWILTPMLFVCFRLLFCKFNLTCQTVFVKGKQRTAAALTHTALSCLVQTTNSFDLLFLACIRPSFHPWVSPRIRIWVHCLPADIVLSSLVLVACKADSDIIVDL